MRIHDLPHPRFPHFPYTTLFRSNAENHCPATGNGAASQTLLELAIARDKGAGIVTTGRVTAGPAAAGPDRKSTRLNSSHANISYAVFRLNNRTTRRTPRATSSRS